MSKVYKKVMKEVDVIVSCKCDICGKEHSEYEDVTAYHNDWGNDSIDSYKTVDVCSDGCYAKAIKMFMNDDSYKNHSSIIADIDIGVWREIIRSSDVRNH